MQSENFRKSSNKKNKTISMPRNFKATGEILVIKYNRNRRDLEKFAPFVFTVGLFVVVSFLAAALKPILDMPGLSMRVFSLVMILGTGVGIYGIMIPMLIIRELKRRQCDKKKYILDLRQLYADRTTAFNNSDKRRVRELGIVEKELLYDLAKIGFPRECAAKFFEDTKRDSYKKRRETYEGLKQEIYMDALREVNAALKLSNMMPTKKHDAHISKQEQEEIVAQVEVMWKKKLSEINGSVGTTGDRADILSKTLRILPEYNNKLDRKILAYYIEKACKYTKDNGTRLSADECVAFALAVEFTGRECREGNKDAENIRKKYALAYKNSGFANAAMADRDFVRAAIKNTIHTVLVRKHGIDISG